VIVDHQHAASLSHQPEAFSLRVLSEGSLRLGDFDSTLLSFAWAFSSAFLLDSVHNLSVYSCNDLEYLMSESLTAAASRLTLGMAGVLAAIIMHDRMT